MNLSAGLLPVLFPVVTTSAPLLAMTPSLLLTAILIVRRWAGYCSKFNPELKIS